MKLTKSQLKQIIREELQYASEDDPKLVNESWAVVGRILLQLLGSDTGRKAIVTVLNTIKDAQEWLYKADDAALEAVGLKSPDFVNKVQELQAAPIGKLAEFIDGLNDEDAEVFSSVAKKASGTGTKKKA